MAKKILIIDDEKQLIEMVKIRLEASGYFVISVGDGVQGVSKAIEEQPDLILLDVLMPKMDGYNTLDKLKGEAETKLIPVIMFTVERTPEKIKKSFEAGAEEHIIKPFDPEELMTKIKKVLDD